MELCVSLRSDIGNRRPINQDSAAMMTADTLIGKVFLGVVCDGMGGYSEGDVASATVVYSFIEWFKHKFPVIIFKHKDTEEIIDLITDQWYSILHECNDRILRYGKENGIKLGTTCSCLLIAPMWYCMIHVGDTRIYYINRSSINLVTEDHTFIAREIREGRLTEEEAKNHPKRHALTQSIGVSLKIIPQICYGNIESDSVFLICSDGFRNCLYDEELFEYYDPDSVTGNAYLDKAFDELIKTNIARGETDNMTAVVAKIV